MRQRPILIAVVYFIAVIVLAHFFVPPIYDWTQNTISDLASQGHLQVDHASWFYWLWSASDLGSYLSLQ